MKKKIVLLFVLLNVCLVCKSQMYYEDDDGQRTFKGLFTLGLNLSQIDGDGPAGYNSLGFIGGIGTLVQWHQNFSTSLELLYSQRGSTQKGIVKHGVVEKFKIHTDYIEMPVCFNLNDSKIFMIGVGISPAILINYRINYTLEDPATGNINNKPTDCLSKPMKEYDLSGLAKLQFRVFHSFSIGAKYLYSVISLRPPCEGDTRSNGQYHNVISFYLLYKL